MPEANTLDALRVELFATLTALRDPESPMDLDRASKVVDVANAVIATGKVEVDFIRATGQNTTTNFFPRPSLPTSDTKPRALGKS